MSVFRPTKPGGTISVSDSASLATMDIDGLPPGTSVFNADVRSFFTLSTCIQRAIDIEDTDDYDSGVFTLANGDFDSGDEGNTLVFQLNAPNAALSGVFTIDSVDDVDTVTVTPAPDIDPTIPLIGSLVLIENALETDVTISAKGTIEAVWRIATSDGITSVVAGPGISIDSSDPLAPIVSADGEWTTVGPSVGDVQDLNIATGIDVDSYGGVEILGFLAAAAGGETYHLRPNNSDTGCMSNTPVAFAAGPAGLTALTSSALHLASAGAADAPVFHVKIYGTSARMRLYECWGVEQTDPAGYYTLGSITTAAGNITSLVVHGSSADSVKAGSVFMWRPLRIS